ncbi:MAG: hypothetical protein JXB26_18095 [Candidatus Aminicenantes bacterium]|nr:hypothetical protein [Candidatus Aminicenantes bacterium]
MRSIPQKIEKWRIRELALVLSELGELLKSGNNIEWANVFFHFQQEAEIISLKPHFDIDLTNKLVRNIKTCFSSFNSYKNNIPSMDSTGKGVKIIKDFCELKDRLIQLLNKIESLLEEKIH